MPTQITVLSTQTQSDGTTQYSGVLWLVAPPNNVVPLPNFASAVAWIDGATLNALRAGVLVEEVFSTGLLQAGVTLDDVKAKMIAKYTAAQAIVTSNNPPVAAIGATYDGTNWSGWSGAPANLLTSPRTTDGRNTVRTSVSAVAIRPSIRAFSLVPGTTTFINYLYSGQAAGDATVTLYDVNSVATVLTSAAVKTVVDFEPQYNQEILGGWIDVPTMPNAMLLAGAGKYYFSVTALPDVALASGGDVPLLSPCDLALVSGGKLSFELGQTSYLVYSAQTHSGKIRFTFSHPVNNTLPFQWYLRSYV